MEIYTQLAHFFELSSLADCSTFPELISCFFEIILSACILIYMFKAVFYTCFKLQSLR